MRSGVPGPGYWVQHPRYAITATLDPARARLDGRETVVYRNRSPDSLRQIAVYLRQNVFAAGSPRRTLLCRVRLSGDESNRIAEPLPAQSSVVLSNLLGADGFAIVPPGGARQESAVVVELFATDRVWDEPSAG